MGFLFQGIPKWIVGAIPLPPQNVVHLHIIQLSRVSTLLNESPTDWKTDKCSDSLGPMQPCLARDIPWGYYSRSVKLNFHFHL